ncbi:MAG TPA: hypothetical protein VII48_02775 [Rhizomicrobium sp.]
MSAIEDIAAERQRQIESEGWSSSHDDEHAFGVLLKAAIGYCIPAAAALDLLAAGKVTQAAVNLAHKGSSVPRIWPFSISWWKPKDLRKDLIRAAALIAAEIDRLDRMKARG